MLEGDGFAVANVDALGDGPGFRKVRRALGVTAFGVNAIEIPPGYETGRHFHDEQEELYFVHRGRVEMTFDDESTHLLGPGGLARVDASTIRKIKNVGDEPAVYLVAGGKDGYVGRDGRLPEGETSRFGQSGTESARSPADWPKPGAPVRIGCSGWNYDDWRGRLYPVGLGKGRWLGRYAEEFDTVEVNSTFYRLASRDAVARWVEQTPDDFLFAAKASRYLTHVRRLREIEQGIERYYERIEPLVRSPKLGPIVWQLPANFRADADLLADVLPKLPAGRHCFEFRHESWFSQEVYDLLGSHGAALVIGDHPKWPFQARGADHRLDARAPAPRTARAARQLLGVRARGVGPADRAVAPPGRDPRLLQQRLGGVRGRQCALAQAAAAAVSRRLSARRSRRDTCICE